MSGPQPVSQYRLEVRNAHAEAFTIHRDVAVTLEDAILAARAHPDELAVVLDMLMLQGYKAHLSVSVLSEYAMIEDAATIARRLLELSVQAVYISADDNPKVCQRRAGSYLAFLWRKFPRRFRQNFPAQAKARWCGYAGSMAASLKRRLRRGDLIGSRCLLLSVRRSFTTRTMRCSHPSPTAAPMSRCSPSQPRRSGFTLTTMYRRSSSSRRSTI